MNKRVLLNYGWSVLPLLTTSGREEPPQAHWPLIAFYVDYKVGSGGVWLSSWVFHPPVESTCWTNEAGSCEWEQSCERLSAAPCPCSETFVLFVLIKSAGGRRTLPLTGTKGRTQCVVWVSAESGAEDKTRRQTQSGDFVKSEWNNLGYFKCWWWAFECISGWSNTNRKVQYTKSCKEQCKS